MKIVNFIKNLFTILNSRKNNQYSNTIKTNLETNAVNYIDKEVSVIGLNNSEHKQKQFCRQVEEKDMVLISDTMYDITSKIYHTYYDCYEDWPLSNDFKFSKWKLVDVNTLEGYSECARCSERRFRNSHPNLKITGYPFTYYYENLK